MFQNPIAASLIIQILFNIIVSSADHVTIVQSGGELVCRSNDSPLSTKQWIFNGIVITNSSKYGLTNDGGDLLLDIKDETVEDEGTYICQVDFKNNGPKKNASYDYYGE